MYTNAIVQTTKPKTNVKAFVPQVYTQSDIYFFQSVTYIRHREIILNFFQNNSQCVITVIAIRIISFIAKFIIPFFQLAMCEYTLTVSTSQN